MGGSNRCFIEAIEGLVDCLNWHGHFVFGFELGYLGFGYCCFILKYCLPLGLLQSNQKLSVVR